MNETLKLILESLEQSVSTAIQKYKSKEDMSFIDLAIEHLTLTLKLMEDQNDESAKEFKASVSGMLAALKDTKNCDREHLTSGLDKSCVPTP